MEEINGFKVLSLHIKPSPVICHTIFVKAHTIRIKDPDKPAGRTLFVINIPPYITENHLRYGFGKVGEVESIRLQDKVGPAEDQETACDKFARNLPPKRFKLAHVVFKSTKSMTNALKLDKLCIYDEETGKPIIRTGLKTWMHDYIESIPNENTLQIEIDEFMADYDRKERAAQLAEKAGQVDNDGWITVTKRGPIAGFEQKESVINRIEDKMQKSKKNKELKNFYTFQIRQSKMQHIVSLRKKFEEDKRKIDRLKQSRRFNPFGK